MSIGLQIEGLCKVRVYQDWSRSKRRLQILECLFCLRSPLELVLTSQPSEWSSDSRIILNKDPIEVSKSKKTLDVSNCLRNLPGYNRLHLLGVHLQAFRGCNEPQKLHLSLVEDRKS